MMLLLEGKSGNTVVEVDGRKIYYQPTEEVIKHREVDLDEVALFESMGICFGRKPEKFKYELIEAKGPIARHL